MSIFTAVSIVAFKVTHNSLAAALTWADDTPRPAPEALLDAF
jgi:hypothetical protein